MPHWCLFVMQQKFIQQLRKQLASSLPGRDAQYKMAHAIRTGYVDAPNDARVAGVLCLIYLKNEEWTVALIQRTAAEARDAHKGQIAFPGGKAEAEDSSYEATALRETEEEIGIPEKDIEILGALTTLYIPVSNFQVYPFVGFLNYAPTFKLQKTEVATVYEVPLTHFQKASIIDKTEVRISPQIVLKNVPYYDVEGKILWGATAMMLSEFLEVVNRIVIES